MISVSEKQVASLPVLEVVDAVSTSEKLPLIVFYHGWTNCKEVVLTQGYELAKRGFRVILPEALYHGVRAEGKVTDHFLSFWEVPLKSVQEFTQLINYYREHDLILNDQIGVGGFSMGGITTCMLMAANDEIKAGVVLSGTPHPVEFCQQILSALPSDVEISPAYKKNQLKLLTNMTSRCIRKRSCNDHYIFGMVMLMRKYHVILLKILENQSKISRRHKMCRSILVMVQSISYRMM